MHVGTSGSTNNGWIGTASNHGMYIGTKGSGAVYIDTGQRMYIGLGMKQTEAIRSELKEKFKLFVSKGVLAEDYSIAPINSWSDFVFNEGYILKKLTDVESFVKKNKHLPNMPSAAEVAEKGYSQHDMNKLLLQKIEELTLYTIEQEKKIERLEKEIDELGK